MPSRDKRCRQANAFTFSYYGTAISYYGTAILAAALQNGYYTAVSLETEGFIHLSDRAQVIDTANRFYWGQPGLVLLEIDRERIQAKLQYDVVPGHGTFPHLYGPLNIDAVIRVIAWHPQPDGHFQSW